MIGKVLSSLLIFFWAANALGGVLTGSLDRTEGTTDETFTYVLSMQGQITGEPTFPNVPGLEVVGTSQSQRMQIINGRTSSERQLIFTLKAQSAGTYTIPSIELMLDDRIEKTLPIVLQVKELTMNERKARPLFSTQRVDKKSLFQGEAAVLNVEVYSRYRMEQEPVFQAPKSPDLRLHELSQSKLETKELDGRQYLFAEKNFLLIPDKSGDIYVPPTQVIAPLSGGGGFFSRVQQEIVASNQVELKVKPLPLEGRSKKFSGLVGNFKIAKDVPQGPVKTGDNLVITFTVEGYGESKAMADPALDFTQIPGLKVYKDKAAHESNVQDGRLYSKKTFNYAIVPNQVGELPLGKVTIQFFDPSTAKYKTISEDLGTIIVEQGTVQSRGVDNSGSTAQAPQRTQTEIKVLGQDILGLHPKQRLSANNHLSTSSMYLGLVLLFISVLLAPISLFVRQSQNYDEGRELKKRRAAAYKMFRKAEKKIEDELSENPVNGVRLIQDQFRIYLGDKLSLRGLSITEKDVESHLGRKGVSRDLVSSAVTLYRDLDRVRYARLSPSNPTDYLSRTRELIRSLEKQC